ncbi:MAG: sodium-dependent dicarboxylate transporter 2/3/5 [Kiritimatiellia bacterium]|jgi:solute carrier family 13 (sodium-dependent dicarboxylate transporter), member 2/3/5
MPQVWEPKASQGSHVPFITKYHYPILVVILVLASFTAFGPRPEGLSLEGQRALGVFVLCALLWVTSLIPLQITSILALTLLPVLGALPEKDGVGSAEQAFRLFGNEAVFFILGAFIMSAVLVKCGLSTRLTCIVLHTFSKSATQLRNAIFLFCAFFSCFMSEHAVAAMFFPVVSRIVTALGLKPMQSRFGMSFFFALAWGCVIGGVTTYLGGARNPLAAGIYTQATGETISFTYWLKASAPIVGLMLICALLVLNLFYKAEPVDMEAAEKMLDADRDKLGPVSRQEWGVGALFILTILGWVTLHESYGLATIALLSVALMFIFRFTDWATVERSVNWGIILMYGGAIALGSALSSAGTSAWLIDRLLGQADLSPTATIIIIAALSLVLTEFISNAAVVSVMLPVAISLAQVQDISLVAITLAVALPSGLTYTLPIGTPATAIAYSSGFMSMKDFLKIGPIMGVISIAAFAFVAIFIWPLMGI